MLRKLILLNFFILLCFFVTAQDVYKTPSGKKYHGASCRSVNNVSEKITVTKVAELGLGPCKICNPSSGVYLVKITAFPRGESTTVQCRGTTKAGTRCKHRTSIANGYCFQHNPDK